MGWSDLVAQPIDRILHWMEAIPGLLRRRKRMNRLLEVFDASHHRWLTLGLLAEQIGLNPAKEADLEATASLLSALGPPGPGRPDRSTKSRGKPRREQLWGLTAVVGK